MSRKDRIIAIFVFIGLWLFTYLIWTNITYAEGRDIINTKDYIEKLEIQEQQMKQLWEAKKNECDTDLDYYHTQAVYLRATIEEETVKLNEKLGLNKRR